MTRLRTRGRLPATVQIAAFVAGLALACVIDVVTR